jgi:hypothetical protein
MTMPSFRNGFGAALILASSLIASHASAAPRAVLELFTSQGCSSCPPADELFATMRTDPDLIALSLPVDYWDRLGWKDTFAKPAFTQRQNAYARIRGDGRVYTPQAVVNGVVHAIGSRRSSIDAAIEHTAPSISVPVTLKREGNALRVNVGAGTEAARGKLIMMPYLDERDVAIGRGENARRTVTYTNIVRDIVEVADWSGEPIAHTIPLDNLADYDGVVVLLQSGSPGRPGAILGADRITLR